MSTYLIGDVHGCYDELKAILSQVCFDSTLDILWLTGDLVARGPKSLEVLRLVYRLGNSVRIVLGNHDLHLLAVYAGISCNQPKDCITQLLEAPDADQLINWLRHQPLLQIDEDKKLVMVHAGISPQWNIETASQRACELEEILASDSYLLFLDAIYNDNKHNHCNIDLSKLDSLRFSINVFTRMRYCFPDSQLDMNYKDTPDKAPNSLYPWFKIPGTIPKHYSIVFGHWASLMGRNTPAGIYGLDTGCCWGGKLTLLRWEDKQFIYQQSNRRLKPVINDEEEYYY